jgi:hypothetical protein
VLASYPSAATVPRDVVFGRFANLGAARESWTAPCYILNGVFANIVVPDEDWRGLTRQMSNMKDLGSGE